MGDTARRACPATARSLVLTARVAACSSAWTDLVSRIGVRLGARNAAELLADGGQVEAALTILSAADTESGRAHPRPGQRRSTGPADARTPRPARRRAARVVQAGRRRPRTEIVASALDALADD